MTEEKIEELQKLCYELEKYNSEPFTFYKAGYEQAEKEIKKLKEEIKQMQDSVREVLANPDCEVGEIMDCVGLAWVDKEDFENQLKENIELKADKEWLDNTNNEQTKVILELQQQIEQLQQAYTITVDKSVIREQELEAQIEKMKCCENCKYSEYSDGISIGCFRNCDGKTLWESAE